MNQSFAQFLAESKNDDLKITSKGARWEGTKKLSTGEVVMLESIDYQIPPARGVSYRTCSFKVGKVNSSLGDAPKEALAALKELYARFMTDLKPRMIAGVARTARMAKVLEDIMDDVGGYKVIRLKAPFGPDDTWAVNAVKGSEFPVKKYAHSWHEKSDGSAFVCLGNLLLGYDPEGSEIGELLQVRKAELGGIKQELLKAKKLATGG